MTSAAPASLGATCRTTSRPGRASTASFAQWEADGVFDQLTGLLRRLARDDETLPARSAAMIHLAMTDLMSRRLTGEATLKRRGT